MSDHCISASFDTLVGQAQSTASIYLAFAIREVRSQLEGTGIEPTAELIAEVLKVAQADFQSAMMKLGAQDIRAGLEDIGAAIREHAAASENLS